MKINSSDFNDITEFLREVSKKASKKILEIYNSSFDVKKKLEMFVSLVIIDLPDSDRPVAASSAFDILSPGGIMIVPEPEVPTGDVGFPVAGEEPTEAQSKVIAFNQWISFIKDVSANHSVSFVELSGGTLAIIRRVT